MVIIQPTKTFQHETDGVLCRYRGQLHSFKDKPAITYPDGRMYWYKDGEIHRDNDQPAIVTDNAQMWLFNGKFHRSQGPAVVYKNGRQEYYIRGQRHRDDGPAIVDAVKGDEFWKNGAKQDL